MESEDKFNIKGVIMTNGEPGGEGYTPEQLEAEKSRTISDAELLKGGAEYEEIEPGKKILRATREQKGQILEHEGPFYDFVQKVGDLEKVNPKDFALLEAVDWEKMITPTFKKEHPDSMDMGYEIVRVRDEHSNNMKSIFFMPRHNVGFKVEFEPFCDCHHAHVGSERYQKKDGKWISKRRDYTTIPQMVFDRYVQDLHSGRLYNAIKPSIPKR